MIYIEVLSLFVLPWEDKIKFALSSCRRTKMIFIYINLAADFIKPCFYDLLFKTGNFRTPLTDKIIISKFTGVII
jgi:hypothetical protein